jgi:hypothetical protein
MRRTILALSLLLVATPAFACTEEELQAKSISLAELVKAITTKDPAKAADWRKRQVEVDRLAERTTSFDEICAAYDKTIEEAKAQQ